MSNCKTGTTYLEKADLKKLVSSIKNLAVYRMQAAKAFLVILLFPAS